MYQPDTLYDRFFRPWDSHEQYITGMAVASQMDMTGDEIRQIRPPLPRVQALPPRFGYPSYQDQQIGIRDIVRLDAIYGPARVDYSQCQSGYQGTSFPALGVF